MRSWVHCRSFLGRWTPGGVAVNTTDQSFLRADGPLRSTAIHTSKLLPVPPFDNGTGYCCCSVVMRISLPMNVLDYGRMARL